jgi:hypothetical protein
MEFLFLTTGKFWLFCLRGIFEYISLYMHYLSSMYCKVYILKTLLFFFLLQLSSFFHLAATSQQQQSATNVTTTGDNHHNNRQQSSVIQDLKATEMSFGKALSIQREMLKSNPPNVDQVLLRVASTQCKTD